MAAATAPSTGPRYAPEDPTLPKPWKGLVDGKTGYLYFWNPETNVTQYERPAAPVGSALSLKSSSVPISSSVHVQQSSQGQRRDYSSNDEDDRYGRGSNGGSKFAAGTRNQESARSGTVHSHNGTVGAGHGGSSTRGHGSLGVGSGSSVEYRRRHEISVTGDNVPTPFASFEATGFPSEILREVRYLLQGGANVVRCAALFVGGLHVVGAPLYVDQF